MISTPPTLPDYPHTSTTDCGEILLVRAETKNWWGRTAGVSHDFVPPGAADP
jgi:hypothetical protein